MATFQRSQWTLPALLACLASASPLLPDGFVEEFDTNPLARGWCIHGDSSAFAWDGSGALDVEWDSTRPNGYFAFALPGPVTERDDFTFGFDLVLHAHAVGMAPGKPGTFQMAAGLIRVADAAQPAFRRGVFMASRNLVEWTWFGTDPSGAITASISPAIVPADGRLPWGYADSFVEPRLAVRYGFDLAYTAADRTLRLSMTEDGVAGPALRAVSLPAAFTGFEVDALSVNAYSDAGQDPRYAGSLRASGKVDRMRWNGPGPVVSGLRIDKAPSSTRVHFGTRPGWRYSLQASPDLIAWQTLAGPVTGAGGELAMDDPRGTDAAFYRVEARRP